MKRLLFFMVTVFLCLAAGFALADGNCGPDVRWTLSDTGVLTISGTGPMDSYYSTSSIPWADQKEDIRSVVVEEGVTSIGQNAFYWCRNLQTVSLPESVVTIEKNAFEFCSQLVSINIPDGVTIIPELCFYACGRLSAVSLPEGLATIESRAFYECESLAEVTVPASVEGISDRVFQGCDRLAAISVAPDNSCYVSVDGVLFDAEQTTLICYPAGKTDSGYTVPDSVTVIGPYAFYQNITIHSITVPGTVTAIGENAFADCKNLSSVMLPEGIVSIGSSAFEQCSSLTSVTIPASLVSLGSNLFNACSALSRIEVAEGSAMFVSVDGVLFSADMTRLLAFPPAAPMNAYSIPVGVTTIGSFAFYAGKNLTAVTFPDTLAAIEKFAFKNCSGITSIDLPEGLLRLDDSAFSSCESLSVVTIPYSCVSLGDGAFDWDDHLTSVTIKNPYTSFDIWGVFDHCGGALTIYAPAGSTSEEYCTKNNIRFEAKTFEAPLPPQEKGSSGDDAWTCSGCGAEMNGGKFCYECGTPRRPEAQVCVNCGFEVPEGMKMNYCPECGAKFE